MSTFESLTSEQKDEVRGLFGVCVRAVAPDDPTGHIPNCGYTNEHQVCGCMEFGHRLMEGLSEHILARDSQEKHAP